MRYPEVLHCDLLTLSRRQLLCRGSIAAGLFLLGPATPLFAQPSADSTPARTWAVLIGVEEYHRATPLRYTVNDVVQLRKTLIQRAGLSEDDVLQLVDSANNPRFQPLRASIMNELPNWLVKAEPNDRVIIFFSGHGVRGKDGKLYLAPLDCDPANPEETGVPVEWLREEIARCKAEFKLLLIDACHAGSEKGEDDKPAVPSKDLGEPFRDLSGVVTIASSTADELSQIWEQKQQSLFTYWLNQGLKGHADANGDQIVDIDELYNYVHRQVTRTAKARFPRAQTPVRIVRAGIEGVPEIVTIQPQSLKELLADMSEQLADSVTETGASRLGVLEFTNDTPIGELLGADYGLLGRWCAEEIERRLANIGELADFSVIDRRRLQNALSQQQFVLDDLGSGQALETLAGRVGGMPLMALGTLRARNGRVIHLQCKLIDTKTGEVAGRAGGSAVLSESEWAMLGRSAQVRPEDRRPPLPTSVAGPTESPQQVEQAVTAQVVARLDERSDGPHPLLDPNFPYKVRIVVNGQVREGVVRGNDYFVPLRKGETFRIEVVNDSGRIVCMRLLVDGLNTLPQKEEAKGVSTMITAPRVNLENARHWILDPAKAKLFAIRGFVSQTGSAGKLREFKVVDLDNSFAARQQFTDQVGMITAAFYLPASESRGEIAIGGGDERDEDIQHREGVQCGRLDAVIHIRYVDADSFDAGNA